MKKILSALFLLTAMVANMPAASAQLYDTMPVPMGNFEEWQYLPGDTMTIMVFPLPINSGMSVPQGWNVPVYTFDDTLSYMGLNVPINANIPLAKVWEDTVNAPQGSKAVVAESFLFSDVLNPMVYSIAASMLDTSLTGIVLPSIVSTGSINLNNVLPMIEQLMQDTENYDWLLPLVDSVDINDLVSGGIPLNGFAPTLIRGYYKYITPNQLDHGELVALGTRYDTLLHRRMLVGAGSKRLHQLSDTVNYELFEFNYSEITDFFPADYPYAEADSLVIFIVSSASDKYRARGSRLYIDSLVLFHEIDTCGRVYNLAVPEVTTSMAHLTWNNTAVPSSWEIEYGESGFTQGRGTLTTVSDSSAWLINLDPGTAYDCYVRSICAESEGSWVYATFTTDTIPVHPDDPEGVQSAYADQIRLYPNPSHGICTIDFADVPVSHLRLYSVEGRLLQDCPISGNQHRLVLPTSGLYFVELQTPQGPVYRKLCSE